jgi:hypothetical protein
MSDTCIVCLGDLGDAANESPPSTAEALPRPVEDEGATDESINSPPRDADADSGKIAHLLPCGHDLHDDCLKPWVERANSCPICRQRFNVVELMEKLGGTKYFSLWNSYSTCDGDEPAC